MLDRTASVCMTISIDVSTPLPSHWTSLSSLLANNGNVFVKMLRKLPEINLNWVIGLFFVVCFGIFFQPASAAANSLPDFRNISYQGNYNSY